MTTFCGILGLYQLKVECSPALSGGLILLKGALMDWGDGRIEPTFSMPRRSRRQRASQALILVPSPVEAFADVRPEYHAPIYHRGPAPEIDYSYLNSGASPFAAFCIVSLIIGVLLFALSHVGPQFWETAEIALAWVIGVAAIVGFVAFLNRYPNLILPILTVCVVIVTLGWLFQEDRYSRRRWDD
jgi:hypothetical protein